MNKSELSDCIAVGADISKTKSDQVLDSILSIIERQLGENDSVQLSGFGSFVVKERTARVGRNPKTGEPIHIAAMLTVRFSPGKAFKEELNHSID
jgi:DNA-binding protein HU-beta